MSLSKNERLPSVADATWSDDENTKVTVLVATFNHESYVRQCLDSVLMQRIPFRVQVLVHDDASTDRTADIVRQYEKEFPGLIKAVCQETNQYSRGRYADEFLLPLSRGEYIAICEGDDYWTDEYKLVKQVEALDANRECDLCIHRAVMINCADGGQSSIGVYGSQDRVVPLVEIVLKERGQIPTASTVIRAKCFEEAHAFTTARPWLTVGDIYTHFFGARRGGAIYIDQPMSAYRYLAPGSWNERTADNPEALADHVRTVVDSYLELDELTNRGYHSAFQKAVMNRLDYLFWGVERATYLTRVKLYLRYREVIPVRYALFLLPVPVVRWFAAVRRRLLGEREKEVNLVGDGP
jgi:glycosyltransferase involved in cell wall biosynthesis